MKTLATLRPVSVVLLALLTLVPSAHANDEQSSLLQIVFSSFAFSGGGVAPGSREGKVFAGQDLRVAYVRDRSSFGLEVTPPTLAVEWRTSGGAVQSVSAQNTFKAEDGRIGIDTSFTVPADSRGTLEVWFKFTTAEGKDYYDSLNGANYRAQILAGNSPVLDFAAPVNGQWSEPSVEGDLSAGKSVRIRYDYGRVAALIGSTEASAQAVLIFKGASGEKIGDARVSQNINSPSPSVAIPFGTRRLEVYFIINQRSRSAYDSNFGRNFAFDVK